MAEHPRDGLPQIAAIFALYLGLLVALDASQARAEPPAKPVVGPAAICFKYSTFRLLAGESITDFGHSAEGMEVDVKGPHGRFTIAESGIWARLTAKKQLVLKRALTSVYRVSGPKRRYAIFGPTSFSPNADRPLIWLGGRALKGSAIDADIYRRIQVRDPRSTRCEKTFTYSWSLEGLGEQK